jgi:hypothetical protein
MTVGELVELLSKFDQNTEVESLFRGESCGLPIVDISHDYIDGGPVLRVSGLDAALSRAKAAYRSAMLQKGRLKW